MLSMIAMTIDGGISFLLILGLGHYAWTHTYIQTYSQTKIYKRDLYIYKLHTIPLLHEEGGMFDAFMLIS